MTSDDPDMQNTGQTGEGPYGGPVNGPVNEGPADEAPVNGPADEISADEGYVNTPADETPTNEGHVKASAKEGPKVTAPVTAPVDAAPPVSKFPLPSSGSQAMAVFGAQMKLYTKSKIVIMFIILALIIPVLAYTGVAKTTIELFGMTPSSSYLLILLPIFMAAVPAMLAGRILSSEFRNRTVYTLFTLPVSRTTYYAGKFLAAFVLAVGVFGLAYGLALISGSDLYGTSYPNDALGSFAVCIAGVFAVTAMAYGLSTYFKKGSTGKVIVIMIFLPVILMMLILITDPNAGEVLVTEKSSNAVWDMLKLMSPFSGFQSMYLLDNGMGGPILGLFFRMFAGSFSWMVYVGVSAAWGAVFFMLGLANVRRKEL